MGPRPQRARRIADDRPSSGRSWTSPLPLPSTTTRRRSSTSSRRGPRRPRRPPRQRRPRMDGASATQRRRVAFLRRTPRRLLRPPRQRRADSRAGHDEMPPSSPSSGRRVRRGHRVRENGDARWRARRARRSVGDCSSFGDAAATRRQLPGRQRAELLRSDDRAPEPGSPRMKAGSPVRSSSWARTGRR